MYINDKDLIGKTKLAGNKNIMSMVFVGLNGRIPEKGTEYKLHRLLSVLLSPEMPVSEKLQIFKTEYDIPVEEKTKEDLDTMCNLSEWVLEKGIERGMERGRQSMIVELYRNRDITAERASEILDMGKKQFLNLVAGRN